ncbi:tripartite tricarboxylate transporter substrate binding protein [Pigmentiphaga soli]|uniref:Tripartite tricarboxylate transporter substrate binding protein n=2 Tax=Pigmentiphaga soli TaxID=1007095 RepID=A0ABP8HAC3_9BURK
MARLRGGAAQACAALLLAAGASATAQTYPTQPIRLVVPYTPGTGYDSIAREVSPQLSQRLGQPVVVENRPGASSLIGASQVARAAPDGYTLLIAGEGTMAAAHLYPSMSFNPIDDVAPITLAGYGTLMLVTNPGTGIKSVADLIAQAHARPARLNYSSPGVGTSQHLKMEMIKERAGIDMLHVPYKGSAGALNDLMGGQIDVALVPIHQALPFVRSGKLVSLAIISPRRNPRAPEVPTLQQAGIGGVEANMWYAFMAPRSTPAPVVARLNAELHAVLSDPRVKERLEGIGLDVATGSPQQLLTIMRNESASADAIIRKNHISMN